MKVASAFVFALAVAYVESFSTSSLSDVRSSTTAVNQYIPDGFTKESWAKLKQEEQKKKATKNYGRVGPRGFQSRSMQSFQEALERGEAEHLFPVDFAKERVARGELREEDVPYMQREGGSWDNTDVRGAKNIKKWLKSDKDYAAGGYKKEQSVSIFGYGGGLDWTGKNARSAPSESVMGAAPKFAKNYKAPKVTDLKKQASNDSTPKKKGPFGLW